MLIKFLKGQVTTSCNICQGKPNTSQYQVIGRTAMTLKNGENGIFFLLKLVNQHICLFPSWRPGLKQAQEQGRFTETYH